MTRTPQPDRAPAPRPTLPARQDGRLILVFIAGPIAVALVTGVASGLVRLGLDLPFQRHLMTVNHGALMVSGFIGTVIGVERAAAFGGPLGYAGPLLAAAGAVILVLFPASDGGALLLTASAAALLLLFLAFLLRQSALPLVVMTVGVTYWLGGNIAWATGGWAPREVVPWWMAFLALTIAGERLELTRFLPLHAGPRAILAGATLLSCAGPIMVSAYDPSAGARVQGPGCVGLGLWLLQHDTARRTIGRGGTATYAGGALLAAYAWLTLTGVALLLTGLEFGNHYDPTLHAFFLGFVFGAIYAHAPIILPAVTGLPFHFIPRVFFGALVVLHTSIALRVSSGVLDFNGLRQASGILHTVAILLLAGAIGAGLMPAKKIGDTRR